MGKLRPDLPRNQWIDGRLFVHDNGFFILGRGRSRWMFFLPGWVAFCGSSTFDTDDAEPLPIMFYTAIGARRFINEVHQEVQKIITELKAYGAVAKPG